MEALRASYAGDSDSDSESNPTPPQPSASTSITTVAHLPPPPISLLPPPNSLVPLDSLSSSRVNRVRSFPHVEGNYALHVYIPVYVPPTTRKELARFLKKVTALVPSLHAVDVDIPLSGLLKDEALLEQVVLGREFHISLGRTVPIRVHQINSMVSMLRQKLQFQRRYLINFNKWEIFVNDDSTRTFMSLEVVAAGLAQV
nr:U6 snRNA phosphodiesterase [Nicotiana tomentosiformis]